MKQLLTTIAVAILALLTSACGSSGDSETDKINAEFKKAVVKTFESIDTNSDGTITEQELADRYALEFDILDVDDDQDIDEDDTGIAFDIEAQDSDGDKVVSRSEYREQRSNFFAQQIELNGDGLITLEEALAAHGL